MFVSTVNVLYESVSSNDIRGASLAPRARLARPVLLDAEISPRNIESEPFFDSWRNAGVSVTAGTRMGILGELASTTSDCIMQQFYAVGWTHSMRVQKHSLRWFGSELFLPAPFGMRRTWTGDEKKIRPGRVWHLIQGTGIWTSFNW